VKSALAGSKKPVNSDNSAQVQKTERPIRQKRERTRTRGAIKKERG
jgi:hypothetical protein